MRILPVCLSLAIAAVPAFAEGARTKRIEHGEPHPVLEYPCREVLVPDQAKKGYSCDGVVAGPAALRALESVKEKRKDAEEAVAGVEKAAANKRLGPKAATALRQARTAIDGASAYLKGRTLRSDAEVLAAVKRTETTYDRSVSVLRSVVASLTVARPKEPPKKEDLAIKPATGDPTRNPGNAVFDGPGMFVADASAYPPGVYAEKLKAAGVTYITLQINNPGPVGGNIAELEKGWAEQYRKAGIKVGFWGVSYGDAANDAKTAAQLTAKYKGDFYIADCEGSFQAGEGDVSRNRAYVDAFQAEATRLGIGKIPRALSSMGRVALDFKPWIDNGWDAMPQTYWNDYTVYQPSKNVKFWEDSGWPKGRIHPTIATYTTTGDQTAKIGLDDYFADLKAAGTTGFSYYLPESYLDEEGYRKLGAGIKGMPAPPARDGSFEGTEHARATTDSERRICARDGDPECSAAEGAEVVRAGERYATGRMEQMRRVSCLVPGLAVSNAADVRQAWRETSASFAAIAKSQSVGDVEAFLSFLERRRRERGCP